MSLTFVIVDKKKSTTEGRGGGRALGGQMFLAKRDHINYAMRSEFIGSL
jgi:hypothetical protein